MFSLPLRTKQSNLKVLPLPYASAVKGEVNSGRDCRITNAPDNDSGQAKFDLQWDDGNIFPRVVYPDAEFLFRRMNEVTLESVNPKQGEKILDIGCGRGIDGVEMVKKGAVVIGLEPSNVMIRHARSNIFQNGGGMRLVRGVGEHLPFQPRSMDRIVCKGALDHFPSPAMVMEQIALVLKPGGKAIIAIANFDSLGFRLGKMVWWLRKIFGFKASEGRMLWEVPEDHTYKFDYSFLRCLVRSYLNVEQAIGVSLLFGLPWWGIFLAKCPKGVSLAILDSLDRLARHLPSLSDVIVLRCVPK